MENNRYEIDINVPANKLWSLMWSKDGYTQWTEDFGSGSTVETDWKTGGKVLFVDSKGSGMLATIAEQVPNEYMSFKMIGCVKEGVEDTTSPDAKQWAGASENYRYKETGGNTHLTVTMDAKIPGDMVSWFQQAWPKALQRLKNMAEVA